MTWQDPYRQSGWQEQPYDPYGQNAPQQSPYGQNPYGQDNSYGQNGLGQPAWQDPYAAQYGLGYAAPQQPVSNGLAVGALIANIVSAVFVCGIGLTWLPGIIVSAVALSRYKTDPESARKLTLWAWVCFTVNIVLTGVIIGIVAGLD